MNVLNFKELSAAAKELEVPFIVDNTLATPYLCQAFEHGQISLSILQRNILMAMQAL